MSTRKLTNLLVSDDIQTPMPPGWWLKPVILATWEAEIRRIVQPRQKDPILTEKKLGTMVPVILAT
jgi:hypothetical protein